MQAPHAQIKPTGLITVVVRDGVTMLHGVKPDEIHIVRKRERGRAEPVPIVWPEIETALAGLPVGAVRPELAEFDVPALDNSPVTFRFRDGRLSFPGHPAHFEAGSRVWQCALVLRHRLAARVRDDTGGYLFETPETLAALEPE